MTPRAVARVRSGPSTFLVEADGLSRVLWNLELGSARAGSELRGILNLEGEAIPVWSARDSKSDLSLEGSLMVFRDQAIFVDELLELTHVSEQEVRVLETGDRLVLWDGTWQALEPLETLVPGWRQSL